MSPRALLTAGTVLASIAAVGSTASTAAAAPTTTGVIYAINANNDLLWYRHRGRTNGTFDWVSNTGRKVGTGWDFKHVFSGR